MWNSKNNASTKGSGSGNRSNDKKVSSVNPRRFLESFPASQSTINKAPTSHIDKNTVYDIPVGLSEEILNRHQSDSITSGADWMSQLKEQSAQFLSDQRGTESEQNQRDLLYKRGVEVLIDKIFSIMQHFMFEFNKVASGTDLQISGTISGVVKEVIRYNKYKEAEETRNYFRARLSTRTYSLIIRGKVQQIDFFLLPVNRAMALSKEEDEFTPLATLNIKISEKGMMWRMSDGFPPVDSLESLSMWLFGKLIEQSKKVELE